MYGLNDVTVCFSALAFFYWNLIENLQRWAIGKHARFSAVRTFLICIKQVAACNFYLVMSRIKKFRVQYELPINCVNVPNNNSRQLYQRVCQVKHLHTAYTQRWICLWGLGEVKEIINWCCGASMTITWYIKLMMTVITAKECCKSQRSSLRGKRYHSSEVFHAVASRKLAQEQKTEDGGGGGERNNNSRVVSGYLAPPL